MTLNRGIFGFKAAKSGDPFEAQGGFFLKLNGNLLSDSKSLVFNIDNNGNSELGASITGADEITLSFPKLVAEKDDVAISQNPINYINLGLGLLGEVVNDQLTINFDPTVINSVLANTLMHKFIVMFNGAGSPASVSGLPAGWSANIVGDVVEITHTVGVAPVNVVYYGLRNVGGADRYSQRSPSGSSEMYYAVATETTKFFLTINSTVAGADVSSSALVNVFFLTA